MDVDRMVSPDIRTLQDAAEYVEALIDFGVDTDDAKALVKMRNALIRLENKAQEARKQIIEPALDEKIDVGDNVAGVTRTQTERPVVTDNTAALNMLEDAGVDPGEVIQVNPRQFIEAIDEADNNPSAVIDHEEYTYYRREE